MSSKSGPNNEPNLFNNSISYNQIQEKAKNDDRNDAVTMEQIMKNLQNLNTTETDLKFEYLANANKLVSGDKIQYFEKPIGRHNYDREDKRRTDSDKHDNDKNKDNDHNNRQSEDHRRSEDHHRGEHHETKDDRPYTPRGSSYGPSYGPGQSYDPPQENFDVMDRYCGFGSEEELNIAKLNMLRQLGELAKEHGVILSQNYNMNSDYKAMKYELELHRSIRDKHNGVKWLSNMMVNICWGAELANDNFNPFEFKLKGWSEQMNDDVHEYYDVLGELYEKYFKSGKPIPPELKLMLMIGGSAVKFHIAHTAIEKIPSLSEAMKSDPNLARKLNEQAVTDKIKEQHAKQREVFEKKSDEQHMAAKKRADDLRMLKEQEIEFMKLQQQKNTKEQDIQQQFMQQQFLQQEMIQKQVMQNQLLDKQREIEKLQKRLNVQRSDSKSMYTTETKNTQKTMQTPFIPSSIRNKFGLTSNKPYMYNDNISIDPNIDNIINDKLNNDSQSRISDDKSRESKTSRRSRKKPSIRIET